MSRMFNLLFALVALSKEFITEEQFLDGCARCAESPGLMFGDLALREGWLDAERRGAVEQAMHHEVDRSVEEAVARLTREAGRPAIALFLGLDLRTNVDRYVIDRLLDEGGLGKIWIAADERLKRTVALKQMRPEVAAQAGAMDRFVWEARVTGQLEHPNIVPIYDLGEAPDPYFAMRKIEGSTLADVIAELHAKRDCGRLDAPALRSLLRIMLQVCDAVAYAHAQGVIHRDLKPQNIVLGSFGEVYVLDWGLARRLTPSGHLTGHDAAPHEDHPPDASRIVGTPFYLSPEQAAGDTDRVGPRSDVYSLGAILFEILTGESPHVRFDASSPAAFFAAVQAGKVPRCRQLMPSVPPALDAVCAKALSLRPEDRYQSAKELGEELRRWSDDLPVQAYSESTVEKFARWSRRHRAWVRAGIVSLALVTVVSVASLAIVNRARAIEQEERAAAIGERNRLLRQQSLFLANLSLSAGRRGETTLGVQLALSALPPITSDPDHPQHSRARTALYRSICEFVDVAALATESSGCVAMAFDATGTTIATVGLEGEVATWRAEDGGRIARWTTADRQILALGFRPGQRELAVATDDGSMEIRDVDSGRLARPITGNKVPVPALAYDPSGKWLASASVDGTARLWDAATGRLEGEFTGHTQAVRGVCFAPDGKLLLTISDDHTARLWEVPSGKSAAVLRGHQAPITCGVFDQQGKSVVTGSWDGTARVWDAASGEERWLLDGHTDGVREVSVSVDDTSLASTAWDGTARVWDLSTGEQRYQLNDSASNHIESAQFSTLLRHELLVSSSDGVAQIFDTTTEETLHRIAIPGSRFAGAVWSPDGQTAATRSLSDGVHLWRQPIRSHSSVLQGHAGPIVLGKYDANGKQLVTGAIDRTARLWNTTTGKLSHTLVGHAGPVVDADFHPGGASVVTASSDHTARLWNCESGEAIAVLAGHEQALHSAAFSLDGASVVTASQDHDARIWNAEDGSLAHVLRGHQSPVLKARFAPDGRLVASCSSDATARLWDAKTGKPAGVLEGHGGAVWSVCFSPNGQRVLTASSDHTARLWDVASARNITTFAGHLGPVLDARFSPDGTSVVTASIDKTARVWEAASGKALAVLSGHTDRVMRASFDRDGRFIVTASFDATARLWSSDTGQTLAIMRQAEPINDAVFSPAGSQVATVSSSAIAILWPAFPTTLSLIDFANEYVPVQLTAEERSRILTGLASNAESEGELRPDN